MCEDNRMDRETDINELRNHHVKKLLKYLGGRDVPVYLQKAIKRSYSEFAEDIVDINKGHSNGEQQA